MKRKEFLSQLSLAGIGISALGTVACKNTTKKAAPVVAEVTPFFKLSLAQWSIHNMIREGGVSPYDFAKLSKEWGFTGLEYVSQLYRDVIESATPAAAINTFVEKNNSLAKEHGMENVLIMIDGEGSLAASDAAERMSAFEKHKKWVDAANGMNCHSIRVNLFGDKDPEIWKNNAVEGLIPLCEYAKGQNVNIIIENHGALSSNAALLMEVIEATGMDNCGTLPDFGNFCVKRDVDSPWGGNCVEEYDKYKGIEEMMPRAFGVSAKSYSFNTKGNETTIDFERMLSLVKKAGYTGFVGVEYEGSELSEEAGILATRDLLIRLGSKMA